MALSKLPHIAKTPQDVYIETSHLAAKGFIEPMLGLGVIPDLIVLRRPAREVATSLFELGTIPARSSDGLRLLLSPDDPGVLNLRGWERLHDYQLCYWYCLEMERRMKVYGDLVRDKGGQLVETELSDLLTADGRSRLVIDLGLEVSKHELKQVERIAQEVVNTKSDLKRERRQEIASTIEELEAEVTQLTSSAQTNQLPSARPVDAPVVSTIILNWNRSDLLTRTLATYSETVTVQHELMIVDNFSEDDSTSRVKEFCATHPTTKPFFLKENLGGEGINIGLAYAEGRFIHLSENDLEYLPGWCEHMLDAFRAFPRLGQLSVFGPVPTDEEVWELKPCSLIHSQGCILYAAIGNVGTSSLVRREVIDAGVHLRNHPSSHGILMPDDAQLSSEIKALGWVVAWSDHYQARNIGHSLAEFSNRNEYYQQNYQSKSWLGEEGWRKRMSDQQKAAKPYRSSHLFPDARISPEKSNPSLECPSPQLWSMFDGWTGEVEVVEFLHALIRLLKPSTAVETGTWHGMAASAIGMAMRTNGFGRLVTVEQDDDSWSVSSARINRLELGDYVSVIHGSSLEYRPTSSIDFLLLDSSLEAREAEFRRFQPFLCEGSIVVFHDTSSVHNIVRQAVESLKMDFALDGFNVPTPRGLYILMYHGPVHRR